MLKSIAGSDSMKEQAGGKAAFEPFGSLLRRALEQAFPHCEMEEIPIKTDWQNGQGIFSSALPFLCAQKVQIPLSNAAERLAACLPERDRLFSRLEKSGGYLNFFPSLDWYAECFQTLSKSAFFSAWSITEEDFDFFAAAPSPAAARIQKTFVRLCMVLRSCLAEKIPLDPLAASPQLLCEPEEQSLIFSSFRLALAGNGNRLLVLEEIAGAFNRFYNARRVWSPNPSLTCSRAALCLICGAGMEREMESAGIFPDRSFLSKT